MLEAEGTSGLCLWLSFKDSFRLSLATMPDSLKSAPETTWRRERIDSCQLSSVLPVISASRIFHDPKMSPQCHERRLLEPREGRLLVSLCLTSVTQGHESWFIHMGHHITDTRATLVWDTNF